MPPLPRVAITKQGGAGRPADVHFVADTLSGVSEHVLKAIREKLSKIVGEQYEQAVVKSVRFLPSTKSPRKKGDFEIVANTVVEIAGSHPTGLRQPRREQVETVLSFTGPRSSQQLEDISIPQFAAAKLQRERVAAFRESTE